jgi:hypothetical protein
MWPAAHGLPPMALVPGFAKEINDWIDDLANNLDEE